ncbi:MAG: BON domain-containing protein [Pirellulales bacterium]|nr:BON domain-containing protein [Pirellulales bacterium]
MSPQSAASDKAILKKVIQNLGRMGSGSRNQVKAAIRNGQVTLSGNIQYESQRRPALKAVRSVQGVRGVTDQLKVPPRKPEHK